MPELRARFSDYRRDPEYAADRERGVIYSLEVDNGQGPGLVAVIVDVDLQHG